MNIVDTFNKSVLNEEIEYKYEYRITKTNINLYNYGITSEVQSYGIEIERKDIINGKIVNLERDGVYNISPQRYKVQELAKILYDNGVSPLNAIEIIGDYSSNYIADFDDVLKSKSISIG